MNGRLTVTVRNTEGVQRRLETKNRNVRKALRAVVQESGQRVYDTAKSLTPVGTGFMRDALRLSYHREGYTYHVGWYRADFGGSRERTSGRGTPEARPFYPLYVVFGTSKMAGRDPLTPALEDEHPTFLRESGRAMRTP